MLELDITVEFIPTKDMKCLRCYSNDLENGIERQSGPNEYKVLFRCRDCKIESALTYYDVGDRKVVEKK